MTPSKLALALLILASSYFLAAAIEHGANPLPFLAIFLVVLVLAFGSLLRTRKAPAAKAETLPELPRGPRGRGNITAW